MWERNDGTGESNILQNQFTAYLVTAVRRKKVRYLRSKINVQQNELSLEIQDYLNELSTEQDFLSEIPFIEQFESEKLCQALKKAKQRDLSIFLAKALEDRSFVDIGAELGMSSHTVASIYYRTVAKIKKSLGVTANEF